MGKRRVEKQTEEEVLKEGEKLEEKERKTQTKDAKKNKIGRLERARVYIQSTYNNTIITLTDLQGEVVVWASAGALGFKGAKKATAFAASKVVDTILEKVKNLNLREVDIFVKGVGSGRESAIRSLAARGIEINSMKDVTPIPHNGCRLPKPRRV